MIDSTDTITDMGNGTWVLHDSTVPVGMANAVVWYYKKTGNYACQVCQPNRYCHHIERVQKYRNQSRPDPIYRRLSL